MSLFKYKRAWRNCILGSRTHVSRIGSHARDRFGHGVKSGNPCSLPWSRRIQPTDPRLPRWLSTNYSFAISTGPLWHFVRLNRRRQKHDSIRWDSGSFQVAFSIQNTFALANKLRVRFFSIVVYFLSCFYNVRPCQFTLSNNSIQYYIQVSKVPKPTHGWNTTKNPPLACTYNTSHKFKLGYGIDVHIQWKLIPCISTCKEKRTRGH